MLAHPLNTRFSASVPSHSICGRPRVHLTLPRSSRTLRANNGPTTAQGAQSAPEDAPPPQQSPQDPFYNRVTELDFFEQKFSGKRLLEELAQQYEAEKIGPLYLNIDSRMTPVRSPEDISTALVDVLTTEKFQNIEKYIGFDRFTELLSSLGIKVAVKGSSSNPFFDSELKLELAKELQKDEVNLTLTIKKCEKLLNALGPLPSKPVIVIDEANKLMSWKESDPLQPQLQELLDFLVAITKQKRQAHAILATSDYFLAIGMTPDKFKVEVLGDLTEEEAQKFFYGDGVAGGWSGIINNVPPGTKAAPAGAKEKWLAIYERCGGNIGLLNQCVAEAELWVNWDAALQGVVAGPRSEIVRGFEPEVYIVKGGEALLWTKEQWKTVLERITTAPHHAVLVSEIEKELERSIPWSWPWSKRVTGSKILLSLVKYNLLALRPWSELARDLPREVYGKRNAPVVTLPLPAYVWAAEAMLKKLKAAEAQDSSDP